MQGTAIIYWQPLTAIILMFFSVSCAAQETGNALLKFQRQGYADALGENHPKVHGFDGRIELQKQGFQNPDLHTTKASDPTRSLIMIINAMSKKLAMLEGRLAALEEEVVQLRKAQGRLNPEDAAKKVGEPTDATESR